jgi:hypothetical protein
MRALGKAILGASGLYALTAYSAGAVDYPFSFKQEQNIDTHQVGHVKINIDKDGNGTLEDFWSNGKQFSGNTFYAAVGLADKQGHGVWKDTEFKGLDGSFAGHAREGSVVKNFKLTKEQMESFDHVYFKLGTVNCGQTITISFNEGFGFDASTHKCGDAPSPGHNMSPPRQTK